MNLALFLPENRETIQFCITLYSFARDKKSISAYLHDLETLLFPIKLLICAIDKYEYKWF